MATGSSGRTTVRPRFRWKRWALAGLLGLALGLGTVAFLRTVHNPFAAGVADPLVLLPADADFVLSLPDFPRFINEVENRPAVARLLADRGFQDFLRTPEVRGTGIPDAVRDAFHELGALSTSLPLGLQLLPDVSGRHLVLAGWTPSVQGGPFRMLLVFKPESWLALAGVNALLSPTLTDWFLADELTRAGVALERFRDSVCLTPRNGRPFYLTRIADTVLLSTEGEVLSHIGNTVALQGVPDAAADRYIPLMPGFGAAAGADTEADITLLARVSAADRQLALSSTLLRLWGQGTYGLVRDLLPQAAGEDLRISLRLGEALDLEVRGSALRSTLLGTLEELTKDEVRALREDIGVLLPSDVFALVGIRFAPGRFVQQLLARPELLSPEEQRELAGWCQRTPSIGSIEGLCSFFDDVFGQRGALVFFRQEREVVPDKSTAGFALVLPLRARARLLEFVDALEREQTAAGAQSLMRTLLRTDRGGLLALEPDLREGVRDDPRVARPAIGLTSEHVLLTNWAPFLEAVRRTLGEPSSALSTSDALRQAGEAAPQQSVAAALLEGNNLWHFLEQSISGWAFQQTVVGDARYREWRAEFHRESLARGEQPGTPEWKTREDDFIARKEAQMLNVERPRVERAMREYTGRFRGLLRSLGFFVSLGSSDGALRFHLELR